MSSYSFPTFMKNVFSNYLDRVQVSIPESGFHSWHGVTLQEDLRRPRRKSFLLDLDRFQYPIYFYARTVDGPVRMKGSARIFIGRNFYVRYISESKSTQFDRQGVAEFPEGDIIRFQTTDSSISEGCWYRVQKARLDSLPPSHPVLRMFSVEEVVE